MEKCTKCKRRTAVWSKPSKEGPPGVDMWAIWRDYGFGAAIDSKQEKVLCEKCHDKLRFKMLEKEVHPRNGKR